MPCKFELLLSVSQLKEPSSVVSESLEKSLGPFSSIEAFGFVSHNVTIVPSMILSTCWKVVSNTIVVLYRARPITVKFWPFMSFSHIVLLLPYTVFVASSLYFTVVFNSTKLSSIPSLRVLFPADAFKHSFPSSSRSLSSSYVTLTALLPGMEI